jgi:tetratricopeptide (TPR) repeat protein
MLQANLTAFRSEFFKFISILGEVASRVSLTLAEMTKQEEELKLEIKK